MNPGSRPTSYPMALSAMCPTTCIRKLKQTALTSSSAKIMQTIARSEGAPDAPIEADSRSCGVDGMGWDGMG
jgi:hypothetical protein